MKKIILHPVSIATFIIALIFSLPLFFFKKSTPVLSDEELRHLALSGSFRPIPKTYKELLKVVDNPKNPLSKEKILLGKELFNDTLLSEDKTISCAFCHILKDGGDDNRPTAIGVHGRANPFHLNSPTVLNAALAKAQFWNGRAVDVEEQAGGPIQSHFEMNMTPQKVVKRLSANPKYVEKFKAVFHTKNITFKQVRYAIGAYERTLLTRGAFDRFLEGDNNAMSAKAKRGMTLFLTRGCAGCHSGMSVGGQTIQKFPLRSYLPEFLGLEFNPIRIKKSPYPFPNKGGFLGKDDMLRFRVPILRNVTRTSPYFHNGAIDKIEEVVRIMSKYQLGNEFTPKEIGEVVAFLKTLEGSIVNYKLPDTFKSSKK